MSTKIIVTIVLTQICCRVSCLGHVLWTEAGMTHVATDFKILTGYLPAFCCHCELCYLMNASIPSQCQLWSTNSPRYSTYIVSDSTVETTNMVMAGGQIQAVVMAGGKGSRCLSALNSCYFSANPLVFGQPRLRDPNILYVTGTGSDFCSKEKNNFLPFYRYFLGT